jgi:hypothetical protein
VEKSLGLYLAKRIAKVVFVSPRRTSLILTTAAAVLGPLGLIRPSLNVGFFGVIDSFPLTFFASLGLLGLASAVLWSTTEPQQGMLAFQWLLFNAALWLAPLVFGDWVPGGFHAMEFFGFSGQILEEGHTAPDAFRFWYHNWPGFWIGIAMLMEVAGISRPEGLIRFAPFAAQVAYMGGLYLFFRNTLGIRYAWFGLWLFSLANWQQQNALLPQAWALALFFPALAIFARPSRSGFGSRAAKEGILFLVIHASLTVTHMLTAIAAAVGSVALRVSRKHSSWLLPILSASVVAAWGAYGARVILEKSMHIYLDSFLAFGEAIRRILLERLSAGSESHRAVVMLRLLLVTFVLGLCVAGVVIGLVTRRHLATDRIIGVMGLAIGSVAVASGFLTGGILPRLYTFLLPVAIYFGAKTLDAGRARGIILVLLVLAIPLRVVSQEGNQVIDFIPQGYISGLYFFHDHTDRGTVSEVRSIGPSDPPPFGGFRNRDRYREVHYWWPQWRGILDSISTGQFEGYAAPSYLVLSEPWDELVLTFLTGDRSIVRSISKTLQDSRLSTIYSNGTLRVVLLADD